MVMESSASIDLDRWVVASGGGSSLGGRFQVHGTIGQKDAAPQEIAIGGSYGIVGGFWASHRGARPDFLFGDRFEPPPSKPTPR